MPEATAECGCCEVRVDHFAAYPVAVVEPLVKAGCPRLVCVRCNTPQVREVKTGELAGEAKLWLAPGATAANERGASPSSILRSNSRAWRARADLGFRPTCECGEAEGAEFLPGLCLDPFVGSGTSGVVARKLGLRFVGIDTSADYLEMAANRIAETGPAPDHAAAARAGQLKMEV